MSKNARCGSEFGGQTCTGSKFGNCCSKYGYCGNSRDYCEAPSCQKNYGTCHGTPSYPAGTTLTHIAVPSQPALTCSARTVTLAATTKTVTLSDKPQVTTQTTTITIPGEPQTTTVIIPGEGQITTITVPGESHTTTVTIPGEEEPITVTIPTTITIPGEPQTTTVTIPGEEGEPITITVPTTIAGEPQTTTVTIPGEEQPITVTIPTTVTIPGEEITVTIPGEPQTTIVTIPGEEEIVTVTIPTTVTIPGEEEIITVTVPTTIAGEPATTTLEIPAETVTSVVTATANAACPTGNPVISGNFESGLEPAWAVFSSSTGVTFRRALDDTAPDGPAVLQMNTGVAGVIRALQAVAVCPGSTYEVSFSYRTGQGRPAMYLSVDGARLAGGDALGSPTNSWAQAPGVASGRFYARSSSVLLLLEVTFNGFTATMVDNIKFTKIN